VLLLGYEWFLSDDATPPKALPLGATRPASQDELLGMFEHLEAELRASGFLYPPDKCPTMIRNIRAMFHRAELTEQEIRTLRGMIKALAHGRQRASGA
jgi:tRNA/rRNA methyltransferase